MDKENVRTKRKEKSLQSNKITNIATSSIILLNTNYEGKDAKQNVPKENSKLFLFSTYQRRQLRKKTVYETEYKKTVKCTHVTVKAILFVVLATLPVATDEQTNGDQNAQNN